MVYISLWCIKRDLPLSRTPDNLLFYRTHPTHKPCWSLSLSLSLCVGGVFLVRMHIYSIYRSLSHTMYDSLVQARYLGCTHRTHTNSLAALNSLTHHSVVSELFPLSLKLSIYLGHTYTCISHSHSIGPSKTLSLSLVLSPSHMHTHTISCPAS